MVIEDFVKHEWFGGDVNGVKAFCDIAFIAHIYDDLIDKDKVIPEEFVHEVFKKALVDLPLNPLVNKCRAEIAILAEASIAAYKAANLLEKTKSKKDIRISHVLRYFAGAMICKLSEAAIGKESAKYHPDIWRSVIWENYEDYEKEHLTEINKGKDEDNV